MPAPRKKRSTLRWIVVAFVLAGLAGGAVAVADPDESGQAGPQTRVAGTADGGRSGSHGSGAGTACGAATAQTIGAIDAQVARRIYRGELSGREVGEDVAHVTGSQELLSALAGGSQTAVYNAVHTIVYTPHWHIVRLRVTRGARVLADVGGPYIIAPLKGSLRQGATKLGSYVVSVQDDVGYVKLVTRFVDVPIDLYGGPAPRPADKFLMGTLQRAPKLPVDGSSVKAHGVSYFVRVAQADAFPSGKLKVALFVPAPSKALSARSCAAVRDLAWGEIVKHVAARFRPLATQYQDFVGTLEGSTGGVAFVREGNLQVAGLSAGPRYLPAHGKVSYHGRVWQVFSWEPFPPARVYFLAP
ncbi:MAG TPA: hypothetical protein VFW38_03935 [Solirubrobacteraceae bacterium]|nr:hypothetical protein [Solirubrobacteraceae bacterium]